MPLLTTNAYKQLTKTEQARFCSFFFGKVAQAKSLHTHTNTCKYDEAIIYVCESSKIVISFIICGCFCFMLVLACNLLNYYIGGGNRPSKWCFVLF